MFIPIINVKQAITRLGGLENVMACFIFLQEKQNMKTLYLAEFKYGEPRLTSFESDRETDKNYMVANGSKQVAVIGKRTIYISSRVSKDSAVFENESDAIDYLLRCAENDKRSLETNLAKANSTIAYLRGLVGD